MNANTAVQANHSNRTPWIMVGAVIAAAVLFGIALIVGNGVLIVVAVAVVVLTAIAAAVLPRRVGQPISFSEEFPANTIGPRATVDGDSTPPINTRQQDVPQEGGEKEKGIR
jgi:fatty acid desaturase